MFVAGSYSPTTCEAERPMDVVPILVKRFIVTRMMGSSESKSRYLTVLTPLLSVHGLCMTVF